MRVLIPCITWLLITPLALVSEIPESSLRTFPPMEQIYHPVSTNNEDAQKNFDRGLTYLFAFNHDIAFASFEKASQLDPNLAMAYWGMSLALGQNVNEDVTPENEIRCYAYIQKALQLSADATPNEREYIAAAAQRYTNDPKADLVPLRFRYREAMKKVVAAYPEDLDAAVLYAESILDLDPWKWWTWDGKANEGVREAIDTLEFVLNRNPLHIGANHFYIHSWEESPTPERALMSAYRLGALLPEAGHLVHMPCHIFMPVGDYESAVNSSKKAIAEDQAYFKKVGLSQGTYPTHYLSHNMSIFARVYMLMEDNENAIRVAADLMNFLQPYFEKMPHLAHYAIVPLQVYLYFHQWKEILNYKPLADAPLVQTYWHFCRAKAFASLGDLDSAQKEKELMAQQARQIKKEESLANNPASQVMELAALDLEATLAHVRKDYPGYISLLNRAIEMQDRLYYDEPPPWVIPLRITLGAALLEQQKYAEAEQAFLQASKSLQRNGRVLFGLFLSLKGQGRFTDAYWIEREMTAALKHASKPLRLEDL